MCLSQPEDISTVAASHIAQSRSLETVTSKRFGLRSKAHSWQSKTASLEHAMQRYSALVFGMSDGHSKSNRMHAGSCAAY